MREAFAIEERKPAMNRDKVLKRVELVMVLLLQNTSLCSHDNVPVFKFAQNLTTNMTNFCSQLFLALAESVSVK